MLTVVHRIEEFTRNLRGVADWAPGEVWSAWRASTELKKELLDALVAQSSEDSQLLLGRQRLCSAREGLKRRLLVLLNPGSKVV